MYKNGIFNMDPRTKSYAQAYADIIRQFNNKTMNKPLQVQADDDQEKEDQGEEQVDLDLDDETEGGDEEQIDLDDQTEEGGQGEDQGDEEDDFNLDDGEEELEGEPQSEYDPDNYDEQNETKLNFSVELATEFSNTVNQFTKTCAEIVKNRTVKKTISDDLDKLMRKIKNIVQAAEDSVQ